MQSNEKTPCFQKRRRGVFLFSIEKRNNPFANRKNTNKGKKITVALQHAESHERSITDMKQFTYTVTDPNGVHARPAGKLATFAKQFASDIKITCGEKEADAKRLISIMSLGATQNTTLTFTVIGDDETDASNALAQFCRNGWTSAQ